MNRLGFLYERIFKKANNYNNYSMQINWERSLNDSPVKRSLNSSSTNDGESRHGDPYYCWEPNWCEAKENVKFTGAVSICPGCSKFVSET